MLLMLNINRPMHFQIRSEVQPVMEKILKK